MQGGVQTLIHEDRDTPGGLHIERVQDCTPIAEYAHGLRQAGAVGSSEMRHCASFPFVLVEQYCNTRGISFHEFSNNPVHVKTMLADPALAGFRIWEGRV